MFTLGSAIASWRSVKQSYIVDSIIEVRYVAVFDFAKEFVFSWEIPHGTCGSSLCSTTYDTIL